MKASVYLFYLCQGTRPRHQNLSRGTVWGQGRFGRDEPENEIPCQKEEANDASDANSNVCSAMSELQSAWKGGEANEVVALIQSALALVGVYEKNASRSACGKANEDVDGLKAAVLGARKSLKDRYLESLILCCPRCVTSCFGGRPCPGDQNELPRRVVISRGEAQSPAIGG